MLQIEITIPEVNNIDYYEYIYTGFFNLFNQGVIQGFHINMNDVKNSLKKNQPIKPWLETKFVVKIKDKLLTIVLDVADTPWTFHPTLLQECDLYFKCQYPIDMENGFYKLNKDTKIPFHDVAMKNSHKIRPLIMPRPLGRKMDFMENNRILRWFDIQRKNEHRTIDMLIFFGTCQDVTIGYNHPHLKRIKSLLFLSKTKMNHNIKMIYRPYMQKELIDLLPPEHELLPTTKRFIPDEEYRQLIINTKSTFNIAGLHGSIPFRYLDAYLSGMLILTDTPAIKWYVPLTVDKVIYDVGKLGYENLTEEEFKTRMERLIFFVSEIDRLRAKNIREQHHFYETFLTPEKVCQYILRECEKVV
jgi:hypothetical protein